MPTVRGQMAWRNPSLHDSAGMSVSSPVSGGPVDAAFVAVLQQRRLPDLPRTGHEQDQEDGRDGSSAV